MRENGSFTLCHSGGFTRCNLACKFFRLSFTCGIIILKLSVHFRSLSHHNKSFKFNICVSLRVHFGASLSYFKVFFIHSLKLSATSFVIIHFFSAKSKAFATTSHHFLLNKSATSVVFTLDDSFIISSAVFCIFSSLAFFLVSSSFFLIDIFSFFSATSFQVSVGIFCNSISQSIIFSFCVSFLESFIIISSPLGFLKTSKSFHLFVK